MDKADDAGSGSKTVKLAILGKADTQLTFRFLPDANELAEFQLDMFAIAVAK